MWVSGFVVLASRYDRRTQASLMQAYLEVVSPPGVKGAAEVVGYVQKWESKVGILNQRYGETLGNKIKTAILVGVLPKDFQELVLQNGSMLKEGEAVSFETVRDFAFNVANQRAQMVKPVPMDVGCMEKSGGERVCGNCEGW